MKIGVLEPLVYGIVQSNRSRREASCSPCLLDYIVKRLFCDVAALVTLEHLLQRLPQKVSILISKVKRNNCLLLVP